MFDVQVKTRNEWFPSRICTGTKLSSSMTYIVESSATSASLQMTARWVVQLIHEECHPEGPWQYWGLDPGESHGAQQGQVKGPVFGSGQSLLSAWMDWEQSWGGLVNEKLVMSWQFALTAQRTNPILGCIQSSVAIRARKGILPLSSYFCEAPLVVLHPAVEH